jgi:PEP-CTERM motif
MRVFRGLSLALVVLPILSFPIYAKADSLVLGVTQSQVPTPFGSGRGIGDAVFVDTAMTIDQFGFDLSQRAGGNVNFFIYDETNPGVVLAPVAVLAPTGVKQFTYASGLSVSLDAGSVYYFGVYGDGVTSINLDPTAFFGDGLSIATTVPTSLNFLGDTPGSAISGSINADGLPTNYASLRVFSNDDPPAVTPEPNSLVLMGTGILAAAGAMRKRMI